MGNPIFKIIFLAPAGLAIQEVLMTKFHMAYEAPNTSQWQALLQKCFGNYKVTPDLYIGYPHIYSTDQTPPITLKQNTWLP